MSPAGIQYVFFKQPIRVYSRRGSDMGSGAIVRHVDVPLLLYDTQYEFICMAYCKTCGRKLLYGFTFSCSSCHMFVKLTLHMLYHTAVMRICDCSGQTRVQL